MFPIEEAKAGKYGEAVQREVMKAEIEFEIYRNGRLTKDVEKAELFKAGFIAGYVLRSSQ